MRRARPDRRNDCRVVSHTRVHHRRPGNDILAGAATAQGGAGDAGVEGDALQPAVPACRVGRDADATDVELVERLGEQVARAARPDGRERESVGVCRDQLDRLRMRLYAAFAVWLVTGNFTDSDTVASRRRSCSPGRNSRPAEGTRRRVRRLEASRPRSGQFADRKARRERRAGSLGRTPKARYEPWRSPLGCR